MARMRRFCRSSRNPTGGVLLALLLPACAHEPAFQAVLPATIDTAGRSIAIIGDLQQTSGLVRFVRRRENNAVEQQQLIADLRSRADELAALVVVGDLVYTARSDRHWDHLDSLIAPLAQQMPVLPAIGNHDYPCFLIQFCNTSAMARGMSERFPWLVPGEAYAVDSGELLLIFLDSESRLDEQGEWLAARLDAASDHAAALVFFHRPAWSNSIDFGAKGEPDVQQYIVPVLRESPLPVVVFSGHIHGYEHIVRDGINYITTAGGGGPRGPLADERPDDVYQGPECPQPKDQPPLRPFNYLLLRADASRLAIEVRGFCRGDEAVRTIERIEIPI